VTAAANHALCFKVNRLVNTGQTVREIAKLTELLPTRHRVNRAVRVNRRLANRTFLQHALGLSWSLRENEKGTLRGHPANPGSPGRWPLNRCVCVCVCVSCSITKRYRRGAGAVSRKFCRCICNLACLAHSSADAVVFLTLPNWTSFPPNTHTLVVEDA